MTRVPDRGCFDHAHSTSTPNTSAAARYTLAVAIAKARADLRALFQRDHNARRERATQLVAAEQATEHTRGLGLGGVVER